MAVLKENTFCLYLILIILSDIIKVGDRCQWPWRLGLIPGRVIPKSSKMVLDNSLLNAQYNMVCIKGKVEQFREGNE